MSEKELSDDDIEEELEKTFQRNENQKNVFEIMRSEESSLDLREKKIKLKRKDKE
ncbi:MAG TPA: hypothetical protein VMV43_01125 [Candidatus Nanopelagicaceae bacterium]|nr:hypothetical protein [Candidatus Nanopelagicaceae bacterium]